MIHFLPPPPARTPAMIRHDRVLQARQAPILGAMLSFYSGIAIIAVLVSLFLK